MSSSEIQRIPFSDGSGLVLRLPISEGTVQKELSRCYVEGVNLTKGQNQFLQVAYFAISKFEAEIQELKNRPLVFLYNPVCKNKIDEAWSSLADTASNENEAILQEKVFSRSSRLSHRGSE